MGTSKDDDDYWYGSDKRSFCFESNEVSLYFSFYVYNLSILLLDNLYKFQFLFIDNLSLS